jgi:hypothetical protein|tara:strand:- start:182 stop:415 length:234 start_codon:yes stop_codon:yes gene_type:complete
VAQVVVATLIHTAVVELITTDVRAGVDLVFGEVRQELDTHRVVILVTITKIIVHLDQVELADTFMDTEVQMDVQVTA